LDFEELFALVRGIGHQATVIDHLEYKVTGRRDGSTTDAAATRVAPLFGLCDWIPRDQHAPLTFRCCRSNCRQRLRWSGWLLRYTSAIISGGCAATSITAHRTGVRTARRVYEILVHRKCGAAGR